MLRAWEEALTAAALPLSRSEGKHPGPLIGLAAPLPQGVTSDGELVDVFFAAAVDPAHAMSATAKVMRPGIEVVAVEEVGVAAPSLQAQLRWAEYDVCVPANGLSEDDLRERIGALLDARSVPAEYRRETKVRAYDLRPLVLDIQYMGPADGAYRLRMRLRAEQENTARADQTVLALGLPEAVAVHRRSLHVEDTPSVMQRFRAGRERNG